MEAASCSFKWEKSVAIGESRGANTDGVDVVVGVETATAGTFIGRGLESSGGGTVVLAGALCGVE